MHRQAFLGCVPHTVGTNLLLLRPNTSSKPVCGPLSLSGNTLGACGDSSIPFPPSPLFICSQWSLAFFDWTLSVYPASRWFVAL